MENTMTKVAMKAHELHTILNDAVRFASTDDTIPQITVVRLETFGTNIVAVATDRFVLGVSRADCEGDSFAATISAHDVKNVLKIAKTVRRDYTSRHVGIDHNADQSTVTFMFNTGESITVNTSDRDFPNWQRLLNISSDSSAGVGFISVNQSKLSVFTGVRGGKETMRAYVREPNKPIIVTVGDSFVGLLMPVRVPDLDYVYSPPAWLTATSSVAAGDE